MLELYRQYVNEFLEQYHLQSLLSSSDLELYFRARKLKGKAKFPKLLCKVTQADKKSIKYLVDTWADQNL